MPSADRDGVEERAAILEFDAKMSPGEALRVALKTPFSATQSRRSRYKH